MKIRSDFVSNSSSSSFVVWGYHLEEKDVEAMVKKFSDASEEHKKNFEEEGNYWLSEIFYDDEEYPNVEYEGDEQVGPAIGWHPKKMKKDETLGAFLEGARKEISDLVGRDLGEPQFIEEAWYPC